MATQRHQRRGQRLHLLCSLLVVITTALALLPGAAQAQEEAVDVCPSGCRYSSIQQAVNAAASGATLRIGAGTYRESVSLRAGVSLVGAGSALTIVNGNGSQPVMTAAGGSIGRSTVIDGLTITGGGGASGAGITIGGGASPTLRNLVIHGNNAANAGGGVSVYDGASSPLLENVTVRNNSAQNGAGLTLSGSNVQITGGRIENNTANTLGGGLMAEGGTLTVDGTTLAGNRAAYGGAFSFSAVTVTLRNCVAQGNSAQQAGGAIRLHGNTQFTALNCRFAGNRSDGGTGGAIFSDQNSLQVSGSTFDGNQARVGAAIHLHYTPSAVLEGNTFTRNQAVDGAGVYMTGGRARVTANIFSENTASMFGGGFVAQQGAQADLSFNQVLRNTAGIDGGGIVFQTNAGGSVVGNVISFNRATEVAAGLKLFSDVQPTVSHNRFEGNQSNDGAAIQIEENANSLVENNEFVGNIANNYGGAVVVNIHANPVIRSNAFVGNRAGISGGAVVINDHSRAVLQSNTISGNSANVAGGVLVMTDSNSQIIDNYISRNVAREHGGGIYVTDGNTRITGNQIVDNQAGGLGGGIVVINGAPTFENNLIGRNRANMAGAGFYISNSQATLRHNTIVSNGRDQNGDGVMLAPGAAPAMSYNVIVGNDYGIRSGGGYVRQSMRNNLFDNRLGDFLGLAQGATDILSNPQFTNGPLGPYYLAQAGAGQPSNSPLIDACTETAQALGLNQTTTRTDGRNDQGLADIGFHYENQPARAFLPVVGVTR